MSTGATADGVRTATGTGAGAGGAGAGGAGTGAGGGRSTAATTGAGVGTAVILKNICSKESTRTARQNTRVSSEQGACKRGAS
jgi:hypothetical protein